MSKTSADTVAVLLDGWRTLSRWAEVSASGIPGARVWNRLVDKLNRIGEAAAADAEAVAALRFIEEHDPDPYVRLQARYVVRPYVPRPDSRTDLARWMKHALVTVNGLALNPRVGIALVPQVTESQAPFAGSRRAGRTWLLGKPLAGLPDWPRRVDGIPLAHLAQVELLDSPLLSRQVPALPKQGVLQFFHDLEAIGDDPGDGRQSAWSVRYLPRPPKRRLAKPDDLGDDAFRPRQFVDDELTWTFPSSLELDLSDEDFERVELVNERVLETVHARWGAYETAASPDAVPMMFGYGAESRAEAVERLASVLPLKSGDSYVLLLDLPGEGPFDGWIGDLGHLEFWIRDSDLKQLNFERCWALLR